MNGADRKQGSEEEEEEDATGNGPTNGPDVNLWIIRYFLCILWNIGMDYR